MLETQDLSLDTFIIYPQRKLKGKKIKKLNLKSYHPRELQLAEKKRTEASNMEAEAAF